MRSSDYATHLGSGLEYHSIHLQIIHSDSPKEVRTLLKHQLQTSNAILHNVRLESLYGKRLSPVNILGVYPRDCTPSSLIDHIRIAGGSLNLKRTLCADEASLECEGDTFWYDRRGKRKLDILWQALGNIMLTVNISDASPFGTKELIDETEQPAEKSNMSRGRCRLGVASRLTCPTLS